jgi:hypothetical protein
MSFLFLSKQSLHTYKPSEQKKEKLPLNPADQTNSSYP